MSSEKKAEQGIFGYGISHNNNLDLLNIVILACVGIIIKLFFSENYSRLGNMGPASATIWGYGLTAIALSIMVFMGIYVSNKIFEPGGKPNNFLQLMLGNVLPISLTLFVIIYTIYLNSWFLFHYLVNKS